MFAQLVSSFHLHPIVDHFTIALLTLGVATEILPTAATLFIGVQSILVQKLRNTSLVLMICGASAIVLSYFTGDADADRLWDTMTPAAQKILSPSGGASDYLAHAALGHYLMYAFLILASWRVLLELSKRAERTRVAFLIVGTVAVGALLYQGKTGGELVYEHGVGVERATTKAAREIGQPPKDQHTMGSFNEGRLVSPSRDNLASNGVFDQ